MNAKEIMSDLLEEIQAEASIEDAAVLMERSNIGCLAVVRDEEIVGTITDRDIVIRILAKGMNPKASQVQDAMSTNPIFCRADDDLETVAARMEEEKIRRLIVRDENQTPVGVVSVGDLAARGHCVELTGAVMEEVCCSR